MWSENGKNLSLFGTGSLNCAAWCRFIMFSTRDKLALALFLITAIIATSTVISLATAVVYGLVFPFICSSSLVFNMYKGLSIGHTGAGSLKMVPIGRFKDDCVSLES